MIISDGKRLVGTYGVSDLVVVAVDDAVLVIPKSKAQKVKQIVNQIKKEKKNKYL